jgi:hypothetical protein
MHKTIILGTLLALFGFTAVAQASDRHNASDRDATRVQREASDDSRGDRHDQYERKDRSRERHDESSERHRESRAMHDESSERQNRR